MYSLQNILCQLFGFPYRNAYMISCNISFIKIIEVNLTQSQFFKVIGQ